METAFRLGNESSGPKKYGLSDYLKNYQLLKKKSLT